MATIHHSFTQDLDSDLAAASTSASISMTGEVGAVGDGARAGSAVRCLSIIPSSLAMDSTATSGALLEGGRSGFMTLVTALVFHTGTVR
jgi:hypothetical protein